MGMIKKIRISKVGRRITRSRDPSPPPPPFDPYPGSDLEEYNVALRVVSVPKQYSKENQQGRFNWLTNRVESFRPQSFDDVGLGNNTSVDEEDGGCCHDDVKNNNVTVNKPQHEMAAAPSRSMGWGDWFFSCFGSPSALENYDVNVKKYPEKISLASTDESDDGSAESSVPSCSMEGQVLKLKLRRNKSMADDVSDITSVPSEDGSESEDESEDESCEGENNSTGNLVGLGVNQRKSADCCLMFGGPRS